MNISFRAFLKNFLIISTFYLFAFFCFYLFLVYSGETQILSTGNFLYWDAMHFHKIAQNGYEVYSTAFFPLFPLLWKFIGGNVWAAVIMNTGFYFFSFAFLSTLLDLKPKEIVLICSVPSLLFMFLPYSEAVFYLSSVLILAGYYKKNNWAIMTGFFLCSFSRPTSSVFIPAIIITEILSSQSPKEIARSEERRVGKECRL